MCELFGLSSNVPTTASLSMSVLAGRSGAGGPLRDGWGIGFYDAGDIRLFRSPEPAGESALAHFVAGQEMRSDIIISHLRHATQGDVSLRNTQPFARELGGRMHLFAHNGKLSDIDRRLAGECRRYRPIGSTDSEIAFCTLMERMAPIWDGGEPSMTDRLAIVSRLAWDLRELGAANFLYSDGSLMFAHGHRRTQPDGSVAPPGLHLLSRACAVDPGALAAAGVALEGEQLVTLIASVPLTAEAWRPFAEGEIVVVGAGAVVMASS